jgi:hypothetical protein
LIGKQILPVGQHLLAGHSLRAAWTGLCGSTRVRLAAWPPQESSALI